MSQKALKKNRELFEFEGNTIPICPFCEKDINPASFSREGGAMFQKIYFEYRNKLYITTSTNTFFCPHCRKILGISRCSL